MSIDIIMPQMGESIAEGTIVKWLKKVGEKVGKDEPLFEISTDKVDAEIPSPAEGVLLEILVSEGETVPINTVVARIESATRIREKVESKAVGPAPPATEEKKPKPLLPSTEEKDKVLDIEAERSRLKATKSSPLVRKIAREHHLDLTLVEGTGSGGRVTKKDILNYIESSSKAIQPASGTVEEIPPVEPPKPRVFKADERVAREPMSVMRKKIAERMIHSRRTSAHVSTFFEVDMTNVVAKREKSKEEYLREGVKLSFLPFIIKAAVASLKAFPMINASIDGDMIVYKKDINIGVAVALDWGLIVPVVKNADEMSLLGLAKSINDLAERARTKRLNPEEVQDGTFTITNPGTFGSLFGTPIINQPQAAILGVGAIIKRPVIVNDAIAVRPMAYLSLSFDHRLIDGAIADQFLALMKRELETFK